MENKCAKCGANIPDGAGFCPNCGTPKQAAPQAAQPVQPMSVRSPNTSPLEGVFNIVFSKTAILIGIAIGILFVWISILIQTFTNSADIAVLINSIGFGALGLMLVSGGIWNKRIDKFARLGMVIIGAYAIVQTMSVAGSITSIFNGLI
jgi:hypothetical protein